VWKTGEVRGSLFSQALASPQSVRTFLTSGNCSSNNTRGVPYLHLRKSSPRCGTLPVTFKGLTGREASTLQDCGRGVC